MATPKPTSTPKPPVFTDAELGDFLAQLAMDSLGLDEETALDVATELVGAFHGVTAHLSQNATALYQKLSNPVATAAPAEYTAMAAYIQNELQRTGIAQRAAQPPSTEPSSSDPFSGLGAAEDAQTEGKRRLEGVLRAMDLHPDVLKQALSRLDADWREFKASAGAAAMEADFTPDKFIAWWATAGKDNELLFDSSNAYEYDSLIDQTEGDAHAVLTDLRDEALAAARRRGVQLDQLDVGARDAFLAQQGRNSTKENVRKFFSAPAKDIITEDRQRRQRLADIGEKAALRDLQRRFPGGADMIAELRDRLAMDYNAYAKNWALPSDLTPEERVAVGDAAVLPFGDWLRSRTPQDLARAAQQSGVGDLWTQGILNDAFEKRFVLPLRQAAKTPQEVIEAERVIEGLRGLTPVLAARYQQASEKDPSLTPEAFLQDPANQRLITSTQAQQQFANFAQAQTSREDFTRVPASLAQPPRTGQPALPTEAAGLSEVFARTPGLRKYYQDNAEALGVDYSRYLRSQLQTSALGTITQPLTFEQYAAQHAPRYEAEFLQRENFRRTVGSPFASAVR